MLDNPDMRAIPRKLCRPGGQAGNEAEQVQRYLIGDAEPACIEPVRQPVPGTPGSMSNTPALPCTTTALLWQNSLLMTRARQSYVRVNFFIIGVELIRKRVLCCESPLRVKACSRRRPGI
jgi:hypothetical protein